MLLWLAHSGKLRGIAKIVGLYASPFCAVTLPSFTWLKSMMQWILLADQVARCTKIIKPNTDEAKYVINVKQIAKVRRAADFVLRRGSCGVLLLACRLRYVSPHNKRKLSARFTPAEDSGSPTSRLVTPDSYHRDRGVPSTHFAVGLGKEGALMDVTGEFGVLTRTYVPLKRRVPGVQFVVGLGDKVAPTDIEEGMRVGCAAPPSNTCMPVSRAFDFFFLNPAAWLQVAAS